MSEKFSIWVLILEMDRLAFSQSAAYSIAAQMDGRLEESTIARGVLLSFPSLVSATRTTLRMHPELARTTANQVPPIVVDVAGNAKQMMVMATHGAKNTILLSEESSKILAGEPVELIPGPQVQLDSGKMAHTRFLNLSSYNMGWAAPLLDAEGTQKPPSYQRAGASPVVHIHVDSKKKRRLPKIPWKFFFMLAFLGGSLFLLFGISRYMVRSLQGIAPMSEGVPGSDFYEPEHIDPSPIGGASGQGSDVEPTIKEESEPEVEATPLPVGFGTVVVKADPADAKIYLDEELVGDSSPLEIGKKSNQTAYRLTVVKDGYESHTEIFNVQADKKKIIDVKLSKVTGP